MFLVSAYLETCSRSKVVENATEETEKKMSRRDIALRLAQCEANK